MTIEQPRGGKVAPPELEVVDVQLVDIRNAPSLVMCSNFLAFIVLV